jgi:dienelactone hydrolase
VRRLLAALALLGCVGLAAPPGACGEPPPVSQPGEIAIREGLWIPAVGVSRREPTHTDAIEALIVAGTWKPPKAGDAVALLDGSTKTWSEAKADEKGWFEGPNLQGGYLFARVASETERVTLLHGVGHDLVYANGEIRPGDPYQYGWLRLPVLLRKGDNDFLFRVSRGRMTARLVPPPAPIYLSSDDATIPDVRAPDEMKHRGLPSVDGQRALHLVEKLGAVVLVNASAAPIRGRGPLVRGRDPSRFTDARWRLPPLTVRKMRFAIRPPDAVATPDAVEADLVVIPAEGDGAPIAPPLPVRLRLRAEAAVYKDTYPSRVDDSVQYFAVNPARRSAKDPEPPALIVSLHGAAVEALGQAEAYASKPWATVVCPTNRRPYGFDWEDWGRTDAHDVMLSALFYERLDRSRVYLTGHSMGGHGTWQVAAHFPEFAAIGPSAGWVSFQSYGGASSAEPRTNVERMLRRAASPSDTLALASNYASMGVYVLHGDADDNVPVTEARRMADALKGFHGDFLVHEQKGAGHWWDSSDEPGADCVDWAPMMDFFARHRFPGDDETREIDFATCDPGISYRCHWLEVEAQVRPREVSRVRLRCDPGKRRVVGSTENVSRLSIAPGPLGRDPGPVTVELDGSKIGDAPWPAGRRPRLWLERRSGAWSVVAKPSMEPKGPHRSGSFKAAFSNRFRLVYGTKGTPAENAWALAKARYDAESWYYRANGSAEVLSDREFLEPPARPSDPIGIRGLEFSEPLDPEEFVESLEGALSEAPKPESPAEAESRRARAREASERSSRTSVILYGNADTNAAWEPLLGKSPVQVRRLLIRIGDREIEGDDLACLFVRPRPGSDYASVGVVAGTGLPGMRLAERLPYFTSGVHFPDVTVIGTEMLSKGVEGVRVAGFFGNDWSVENGEFAWRD